MSLVAPSQQSSLRGCLAAEAEIGRSGLKTSHGRVVSINSVSTAASAEDWWRANSDAEDVDGASLKSSSRELASQLAPPVRRTFVHFPLERPVLRRVVSAPGAPTMELSAKAMPTLIMRRGVEFRAALGSSQLPTIGSADHEKRRCKPCAFFWKGGGCQNGIHCKFCHLCDAGEKKFRRKETSAGKAQRRLAVQARQ